MFGSIKMKLTVAALSLLSFGAFAETSYEYSDMITPTRVDVGVGVGDGRDRDGDRRDRDRRDRDRRDRRDRDRARVSCFAENRSGELFRAIGYDASRVQDRALDMCYSRSFSCRPMGCEWL